MFLFTFLSDDLCESRCFTGKIIVWINLLPADDVSLHKLNVFFVSCIVNDMDPSMNLHRNGLESMDLSHFQVILLHVYEIYVKSFEKLSFNVA